jgi:hypothetical protein
MAISRRSIINIRHQIELVGFGPVDGARELSMEKPGFISRFNL